MNHRASGDRRTLKKCKKTQIANWKVFTFELLCSETGKMWNLKLTKRRDFLGDHKGSQFAKLFSSPLRWQHERMLNKGRELQHQLKLFRISFLDKYFLKELLLVCLFICIYPPISSPSGGRLFSDDLCLNMRCLPQCLANTQRFNTQTQSCVSTAIFKVNKQDTGKPQALSLHQTPDTKL